MDNNPASCCSTGGTLFEQISTTPTPMKSEGNQRTVGIKIDQELSLTPLNTSDQDFLYELMNDPEVFEYGLLDFSFPESDIYIQDKLNGMLSQAEHKNFIILHNDEKIGIAHIYNINYINSKANVGILIKPKSTGKKVGAKTFNFLVELCFNKMNIRKIEVSIAENNIRSIKMCERLGFQKEGTLKQSVFKNGKFEDIHLYGLINQKRL